MDSESASSSEPVLRHRIREVNQQIEEQIGDNEHAGLIKNCLIFELITKFTNGCTDFEHSVKSLMRYFGIDEESVCFKSKDKREFVEDVFNLWKKKEGSTVLVLRETLKKLAREDCIAVLERIRWNPVTLYIFIHRNGQTPFQLKGDDIPASRKLIEHVRPNLRQHLESVHGSHCPPFRVDLKRHGLKTWDTPVDAYTGQQVDIYLEDITDKPADNLLRPHSDSVTISNQPANRYGIIVSFIPPRGAATVDWDQKLLFGFREESTATNTANIPASLASLNISTRRGQNVGHVQGTQDIRTPDICSPDVGSPDICSSDICSLHSEYSVGYAYSSAVPQSDQDHFELLGDQPDTSRVSSVNEVDLEWQAASKLIGFHPEAGGSTGRDTAWEILKSMCKRKQDGCYVIRPSRSPSPHHHFTLSVTYLGDVHHVSILRNDSGMYNFFECTEYRTSLDALIDHYKSHCLKPGLFLKTPVP